MNALTKNHSNAEEASRRFIMASMAWRLSLKWLCRILVSLVVADLLAPPVLPADKRESALLSAAASTNIGAPSQLEMLYHERATRDPTDAEAFEGMAILQVGRGDYAHAIESYHRVLELTPNDHDAKLGLGRTLAYSGQYAAALRSFERLLQERPDDTDALEGLARVQAWAGRPAAALPAFQSLAARYPANPEYALGLARVEMNLRQYPAARKTLSGLLAAQPRNRDAQLQLAYLELFEGHQAEALRRFNHLIAENPTDGEALLGNARIAYYRGDLKYARDLAAKLLDDDPDNATALLPLADLERALHNAPRARALLERLEVLDPRNPEVRGLENGLRSDSRPTLHTSASFAREIASGFPSSSESLSAFGAEATWGFSTLPRSESYLTLAYLPSQSPNGGIQGAAGPSEFFYRQTTYVFPQLTVRSGWGLARFGPGDLAGIPTQEQLIPSARMRPMGFVSLSYALRKKLTMDLAAGRSAVTCTPTAVRLGVMEDRFSAALDYRFDAKTDLRVERFASDDSTVSYPHPVGLDLPSSMRADQAHSQGTSFTLDRQVFRRSGLAVDLGYTGLTYGFSSLRPYLGMFTPGFYQRQYLTTHVTGKIRGPLGYDFSGGAGIQQIEHGGPKKPALLLSPAFTLTTSARLSLTMGYTYYDNSQSLGTLRGDAVRLSTDWKF